MVAFAQNVSKKRLLKNSLLQSIFRMVCFCIKSFISEYLVTSSSSEQMTTENVASLVAEICSSSILKGNKGDSGEADEKPAIDMDAQSM